MRYFSIRRVLFVLAAFLLFVNPAHAEGQSTWDGILARKTIRVFGADHKTGGTDKLREIESGIARSRCNVENVHAFAHARILPEIQK